MYVLNVILKSISMLVFIKKLLKRTKVGANHNYLNGRKNFCKFKHIPNAIISEAFIS